jgi:ankyrin repeat protein
VNAKNEHGNTTLASAARGDDPIVEIVEMLINAGADVNTDDDDGQAVLYNVSDPAIVQLMLDNGADSNHRDEDGYTALSRACATGDEDIVELLISRGGDVKTQSDRGRTLLMLAVMHGHPSTVNVLLDKSISIYDRDTGGDTVVSLAVYVSRRDAAQRLIAAGADVNITDADGATPLTGFEDAEIGVLLLDNGADASPRVLGANSTDRGVTLLHRMFVL